MLIIGNISTMRNTTVPKKPIQHGRAYRIFPGARWINGQRLEVSGGMML
jgi:hypothetical protein